MNVTPLDWAPFTVTTTDPLVVFEGTIAVMDVEDQLETWSTMPLKATLLVPCVVPKPVPVITTALPAEPRLGDNDAIEILKGVA